MNNQKRTIMGSCDYSIETLKNLKRDMSQIGAKNSEILWALGGIICAMTSNLLQICDQVFNESAREGQGNAKEDLRAVQVKFNAFIDRMVDNA
jgi:hypothetical protein